MARRFVDMLADDDRRVLLAALRRGRWSAGERIVRQGDPGSEAFILLDGRAEVTVFAEGGRVVLTRALGPGDLFGEFALIDGAPRTAEIAAVGTVEAGRLDRAAFLAVMAEAPGVGLAVMRQLVEIIRALSERVTDQTTLPVRERLLRELARLGRQSADGPDAGALAPPPTHARLAANIGTHREAVTKLLSAFARDGLVVKGRGALRLPSLRALERAAARGPD